MPMAAIPAYLENVNLSTASPGLRFGMYLGIWDEDYRIIKNKEGSLSQSMHFNPSDIELIRALVERQSVLAQSVESTDQLFILDGTATSPFTTGLGNEHPLENGFAFLDPYGLPYLPGSGVKGVVRQAACELASEDWGETKGWDTTVLNTLFGMEGRDDEAYQRGALMFWDVLPRVKGDNLRFDVMTPHQNHYYLKNESPHESGQPNPITFLTIPDGSGFSFHVQCNQAYLEHNNPALSENNQWKTLLGEAFEHAFNWLGFGAKTSVGYGAMRVDQQAAIDRKENEKMNQFESLSDEEKQIEDLRRVFESEMESGVLSPSSQTASDRVDLLRSALEWESSELRQQAAELIVLTVKEIPWSKKSKPERSAQLDQLKAPE